MWWEILWDVMLQVSSGGHYCVSCWYMYTCTRPWKWVLHCAQNRLLNCDTCKKLWSNYDYACAMLMSNLRTTGACSLNIWWISFCGEVEIGTGWTLKTPWILCKLSFPILIGYFPDHLRSLTRSQHLRNIKAMAARLYYAPKFSSSSICNALC